MNILLPYVCVELSLSEQLTLLSTAAHMLLAMAHEDKAGTKLMPSQLYIDIMIMIKNAYFCVAKAKVDDPIGKFFLEQIGLKTFLEYSELWSGMTPPLTSFN